MTWRNYQIESDYRMDESQYGACPSGYSVIEHPFRVLVHDDECRLLLVGTATFGPANDSDCYAMQLIESIRGWSNALIINRVDLTTHRIVARSEVL